MRTKKKATVHPNRNRAATTDERDAADAAGLLYVTDAAKGVVRHKKGQSFTYLGPDGRTIRDMKTLSRIRALVIPPAWTDVWICRNPNGHLQVTGRDARGRKQYRYHARWRAVRDENKYERLVAFAQALPRIRRRVSSHLRQKGLPREKVLATIVKLLETTLVRVGNNEYARTNQSFGLTTMRDRHTKVTGSTVRMEFQGKSGIDHQIAIEDARIARIVKRCQDLPGQELFQYVDDQGDAHDIGSGDVNDYLREISGHDSPPKIFAPGPEQPWPLRHYASAKISTRRRPPNATSRQQSSASPSG